MESKLISTETRGDKTEITINKNDQSEDVLVTTLERKYKYHQ